MSNGRSNAHTSAEEENERQAALQKWLTEAAGAKIKAALEDASLPFIERDAGDDEQLGPLDHLMADYDPIIDVGTGSRFLSEEIKHPLRCSASWRKG
jgi:hypothetical protein